MSKNCWSKFIIKVSCEKNSGSLKLSDTDQDENRSTLYLCRVCSFFRSYEESLVKDHLSSYHQPDYDLEPHDIDFCANSPSKKSVQSPLAVDTHSVGSCSPPTSPLSPVIKDMNNGRKKVIITLSNPPTNNTLPLIKLENQFVGLDEDPDKTDDHRSQFHLKKESETNSNMETYPCPYCERKFCNSTTLERHLSRAHGHLSQDFDESENAKSSSLLNCEIYPTLKCESPGEHSKFACPGCDRHFKTAHACKLHSRVHNQQRTYACPDCPQVFCDLGNRNRHIVHCHNYTSMSNGCNSTSIEMKLDVDCSVSSPARKKKRSKKTSPKKSRRPLGRPRKSGFLYLESQGKSTTTLGSPSDSATSGLSPENRYRTILPKPNNYNTPSNPQPAFTMKYRRKYCRSLKPKSVEPVYNNNLSRLDQTVLQHPYILPSTKQLVPQPNESNTVVVLHSSQPTTLTQNGKLCNIPAECKAISVDQCVYKQPHVLTVTAAYASQLPASTSLSDSGNLTAYNAVPVVATSGSNDDPTGQTSMLTIPGGAYIPAVQIYPASWSENQTTPNYASTDLGFEHSVCTRTSYDSNNFNVIHYISDQPITESTEPTHPPSSFMHPVQVYPVIGPDGVTTYYYAANSNCSTDNPNPASVQIDLANSESNQTVCMYTDSQVWTTDPNQEAITSMESHSTLQPTMFDSNSSATNAACYEYSQDIGLISNVEIVDLNVTNHAQNCNSSHYTSESVSDAVPSSSTEFIDSTESSYAVSSVTSVPNTIITDANSSDHSDSNNSILDTKGTTQDQVVFVMPGQVATKGQMESEFGSATDKTTSSQNWIDNQHLTYIQEFPVCGSWESSQQSEVSTTETDPLVLCKTAHNGAVIFTNCPRNEPGITTEN